MSITRQIFCYLVVLNEKFLTQLASDLLLQIEQVLRLIGIILELSKLELTYNMRLK
ncbi:hypothetical protein PPEP_a4099 [Pseudoalteromonas peptidolytica F12-50-A1]|uniref:Uncharacterized protein n=1 Tax=Pseudoalteromonas peptidolytica F12-50-A1 TaxID=1315280 RepID=A0A8I0T2S6_9GAMM|nr:hypothetical protein [Pseudoalteromonas peptidolytica F12-50-A1]